MLIARVTGTLVATIKHPAYEGQRVLMVQPVTPEGEAMGDVFYAVAHMQAGVGDLVIVNREGGSARIMLDMGEQPVHAAIAGIVDQVDLALLP
jgi:microcompartment protein CcmK/EutM